MSDIGRLLILFGIILIAVGVFFTVGGKIPWLGKLPGDIYIQKKGFTLFFPITTSIIISVIISLALMLFRKRW